MQDIKQSQACISIKHK